jgi:hypothetical protein
MFKTNSRMFSNEIAVVDKVDPAVTKGINSLQTLWEVSENSAAEASGKRTEEAAYL